MGGLLDQNLKDTHACTHTHTCNPAGPDNSHTHTCFHVHRKVVSHPTEEKTHCDDTAESTEKKAKKRPSGNCVAVRKYREKKKAEVASLEKKVAHLETENEQLKNKIRDQDHLLDENCRLKCLLAEIKGRIGGEIGSFPYQRPSNKSGDVNQNFVNPSLPGACVMNLCNWQCDDKFYCLQPVTEGQIAYGAALNDQDFTDCQFENLQCLGGQKSLA